MFNVVNTVTELIVLGDGGEALVFETGKEAGMAAARLTKDTGVKHRSQKIVPRDEKWREREGQRLRDGTYKPVVWASNRWFYESESGKNHYAHVSLKDPNLIAYTASEDDGAIDKQMSLKPGSYLKKYFGGILTADTIRDWATQHSAVHGSGFTMKITDDPDEIERIYRNGPSSCMVRHASEYRLKQHPSRIYGKPGDLAVAYLENGSDITARTVIWPAQKRWVRIYGDEARLSAMLKNEGYRQGSLHGAKVRLLKERFDGKDCFVSAYIDSGCGFHFDKEGGDFLYIAGDNPDIHSGAGPIPIPKRRTCPHCSQSLWDNGHGHRFQPVRDETKDDPTGQTYTLEQWCPNCINRDAFYCHGTNALWTKKTEHVQGPNNRVYRKLWVDREGAQCERTKCYYARRDINPVIVAIDGDGNPVTQQWGADSAIYHAFTSKLDGKQYSGDLLSAIYRRVPLAQHQEEEWTKREEERKKKERESLAKQTAALRASVTYTSANTVGTGNYYLFSNALNQTQTVLWDPSVGWKVIR